MKIIHIIENKRDRAMAYMGYDLAILATGSIGVIASLLFPSNMMQHYAIGTTIAGILFIAFDSKRTY